MYRVDDDQIVRICKLILIFVVPFSFAVHQFRNPLITRKQVQILFGSIPFFSRAVILSKQCG